MKREDAKEMLPIIEAYVEGKEIEYYDDVRAEWRTGECFNFDGEPKNYRIKPEPEHRPFNSCDELIRFWDKHCGNGVRPKGILPLIWVKCKLTAFECFITDFNRPDGELYIHGDWFNLEDLFDKWEFLDGTPCGAEVTE